jgi:uncharacterized protein involved in exopolysaccharide biosynthesis
LNHESIPSDSTAEMSDLYIFGARIWRSRWLIVLGTLVGLAGFTAIAFLTTPVYRSTTVLIPTFNERSGLGGAIGSATSQLSGLASLVGVNVGTQDTATEEALAVLSSRDFIGKFIQDRNLLPVIFSRRWNQKENRWRTDRPPTLAKGVKTFNDDILNIDQDKKTGLITLYVEWTDRNLAADWANGLVQGLNAEMRTRAIAHSMASIEFLNQELTTTTTVETKEAINRLIEAQIKQRMLASVSPEYAFRVVDRALPADADDPARPKRAILIAIGTLLGFSVGFAIAFLRSSLQPQYRSRVPN